MSLVVVFGMVAVSIASPVTPRLPTINRRQIGASVAAVGPCTVSALCIAFEHGTNNAQGKLLE
jgi:hypothetical protein